MGGYISKFSGLIWAKKETRILILGLVRDVNTGQTAEAGVLMTNAGQCWQDNTVIQVEGMWINASYQ
jgi:hypothetical protein